MEYLNKVLGIKVTNENAKFEHLPNYVITRYNLQKAFLDRQKVVFLYPKTELVQHKINNWLYL